MDEITTILHISDEDFEFVVKRGQKIKMGQKIAENRSPKQLAES